MSIPSDLLDQLLTGYLDNALSPDERVRVESLLQTDQQVAAELAELRQLQASLRSIADSDSSVKLDAGFADRVLGAAVDRARTEGLSDNHPLVLLADQRSVSTPTAQQSFPYRYAAIMIGLAASITIAVLVLRPEQIEGDPNPRAEAIAKLQSETGSDTAPMEPSDLVDPSMEAIASSPEPSAPEPVASSIASVAPESPVNAEPMITEFTENGASPAGAIAATPMPDQPFNKAPRLKQQNHSTQQPAIQLGVILVLDVRLTVAGRMEDAISASMRVAGLDQASEKELPNDLVDAIAGQENGLAVDDDVTVMYLQASAKKLDRFYLSLMSDQVGIGSVGMSLATNTPILKLIDSISPDPTTVRHAGTALELSGDRGIVNGLVGALSQLKFAPLSREAAGAMSPSGPDEPSQILLLIR